MQLFVPKSPIMWELSVSKLKFERFAIFQKIFLVKNGIFHSKFYIFIFRLHFALHFGDKAKKNKKSSYVVVVT